MKKIGCALSLALLALVTANAALLGEYTFNDIGVDGQTEAERIGIALSPSSEAAGASLSVLGTNTIQQLDFMGLNNLCWPNVNDSFSFGNNIGQAVMFFHRADEADPLTPTAWGPGGETTAMHSPLSFTVRADASHTITVSNIVVGTTGATGSAALWTLQEENAAQGTFVVLPGSPGYETVSLSNAVVIAAGAAKTFTISMDSYVHGAVQYVDYIQVHGSIAAGTASTIGEYTFNDTGSGTEAERMLVAMGATNETSGVTLSQLGTNTTYALEFGGFNNTVPNPATDAFSFLNAGGEDILGMRRADSGVGSAFDQQSDTSAAVQPLNFTVYAGPTNNVAVHSIEVGAFGDNNIFAVQEAGAARGPVVYATNSTSLVDYTMHLASPVVVPAGTSKAFTIYMNSGSFSSEHWIDNIKLQGTTAVADVFLAATIIDVSVVSGSVVKMVVGVPGDADRYWPVYETDLVLGGSWTNRIAHSDNAGGPFTTITNLSHSSPSGGNVEIYLEADVDEKFFRVQGE
ncbi:MAG: hypothetical protein ABFR33_05060 [Verrucomicrobiota bacterium]